jgi:PAS domain S-box-containing protein
MSFTPYIWPGTLAFFVPLGFMVYMFRFRDVPGARPFSLLMGITSLWTLFHLLNLTTVTLALRMVWVYLQIIPFVLIAPTILLLALEYTGREQWLRRRLLIWLFVIPAITVVLVWTSAYHPFYRSNYVLDLSGAVPLLHTDKGVWYWVSLGYTYTLVLVACGLLVTTFPVGTPYFWNGVVIAVGVLLPFAVDLLGISGIMPSPGYSFTPLVFIFTGALQMWAMLRLRLFDLIPVARATMLEYMPEGVIVLDGQQRIVDVNPAAAQLLAQPAAQLVGQVFAPEQHFADWPQAGSDRGERPVEVARGSRWYHLSQSPLRDRRQLAEAGTLMILRDVTALKQAQLQFVEQQRALAMTNERAHLARELHDGLGQVLGYIKMRAQVARDLLAQGETAALDEYLANLVAVSQEAHSDIREYLMSVRAATAAEPAFLQGLQAYLTQYRYHYGIHAQLHVAPPWNGRILSPTAEMQIIRIVQEALSNTRKHAHVNQVQVRLSIQAGLAHIHIQDDGCGFNLEQTNASGATYGLRFMRERAEELNGRLMVESAPGQGTAITVWIPLQEDGT